MRQHTRYSPRTPHLPHEHMTLVVVLSGCGHAAALAPMHRQAHRADRSAQPRLTPAERSTRFLLLNHATLHTLYIIQASPIPYGCKPHTCKPLRARPPRALSFDALPSARSAHRDEGEPPRARLSRPEPSPHVRPRTSSTTRHPSPEPGSLDQSLRPMCARVHLHLLAIHRPMTRSGASATWSGRRVAAA